MTRKTAQTEPTPCRKCATPNPPSNQYCRKCGAVLSVSTAMVRAQRKPVMPRIESIEWRWVVLGALIILGILVLFSGLFGLAVLVLFDISAGFQATDLGGVVGEFIGLSIVAGAVFLAAFGCGGIAVAWLSRRATAAEPAIAAAAVLLVLAGLGGAVVSDILVVTAILFVPATALAAVGARLGSLFLPDAGVR